VARRSNGATTFLNGAGIVSNLKLASSRASTGISDSHNLYQEEFYNECLLRSSSL
jgi:hypothetical protein